MAFVTSGSRTVVLWCSVAGLIVVLPTLTTLLSLPLVVCTAGVEVVSEIGLVDFTCVVDCVPSALVLVRGMVVEDEGVLLLLLLVVGGLDVLVLGGVEVDGVDDVVAPVPATCRL